MRKKRADRMVVVAVTDVLVVSATIIGSVAALVTGLGVLAKSAIVGRPLRWVWRRLVSEPIGTWHRDNTRAVVDERIDHLMHHPNSGSSLLDLSEAVASIGTRLDQLLRHDDERDQPGRRYGGHSKGDPDDR